jgi:hypothetical protein
MARRLVLLLALLMGVAFLQAQGPTITGVSNAAPDAIGTGNVARGELISIVQHREWRELQR